MVVENMVYTDLWWLLLCVFLPHNEDKSIDIRHLQKVLDYAEIGKHKQVKTMWIYFYISKFMIYLEILNLMKFFIEN